MRKNNQSADEKNSPLEMPAVGASPVAGVLLAAHMERLESGFTFEATSRPGHLLHYVLAGAVEQECNGRRYELRPGCVLWYHEDEWVQGQVIEVPWRFYSINFVAPLLPPPPEGLRLFQPPPETMGPLFAAVVRDYSDYGLSETERLFRVQASVCSILGILAAEQRAELQMDVPTHLWWRLEVELRRQLDQPIDIALMKQLAHASAATITRSCHQAVGLPPMKRIKQIRLNLARGLVQRSDLKLTEIARRVGYPRVHEFSRDYRAHFGVAPSREREKG